MAAENHVINYENALKNLDKLLKEHIANLTKGVEQYEKFHAELAKLPSDIIKKMQEYAKALEEVTTKEEEVKKSASKTEAERKKSERSRLEELRLMREREKAVDKFNAQEAKAQALLEKSANVYNKVEAKIKTLTQTYNNIATKKELGIKLSTREEAQLNSLEKRLERYNGVLKKVDANIGKHQRNVGNYKSGFDGLGNSINQITREFPAFANSAQTGFMALSNNIPTLVDEISRVSASVKALRAQGQQVPGVMSQILKSFFSWQTLLSVGVVLLTMYGDEIVDFVSDVVSGNDKINSAKIAVENYNKALESTEYQKAVEDVTRVGIAFESAKEGTISKKNALEIYNETLGETFGKANDLEQAEKLYRDNTDAYLKATMARVIANQLLADSAQKAIENERLKKTEKLTFWETIKAAANYVNPHVGATSWGHAKGLVRALQIKDNNDIINANEEVIKEQFEILRQYSKFDTGKKTKSGGGGSKRTKTAEELAREAEERRKKELDYEYRFRVAKAELIEDETAREAEKLVAWYDYQTKLNKDNKKELEIIDLEHQKKKDDLNDQDLKRQEEKAKKEEELRVKGIEDAYRTEVAEIDLIEDEKEREMRQLEAWYAKELKIHEKNEAEIYLINLEYTKRSMDLYKREYEDKKANEEKALELRKKLSEHLDNLSKTALSNTGFGSLSLLFDEEMAKMWETAETTTEKMALAFQVFGEIVSDVFSVMKQNSDRYYENQFNKLEKEKELALKYAGENSAGREAIEEQYNQKSIALKREQAKREKQMAIFQAMINIATGVVSAISQVELFPYNFVLASIIGAMGAIQIANIMSQPLPQFYKGTDNAPEGWAIVDEQRPEVHTDKAGNVKSFGSNKGANLRYLEKGDKIFKSHSDFFREMGSGYVDSEGVLYINHSLSKEDMLEVMEQTMAKQPKEQTFIDEKGFRRFIVKGQTKAQRFEKRVNFRR